MADGWTIARTLDEIDAMAEAWLACDQRVCAWTEGAAKLFGSEAAWPLMVYLPKFLKGGHDADPLDHDVALERLEQRLEFLLEKAEGERGISTPKAREQVCAYLWLFGRDDFIEPDTFAAIAKRARLLLADVQALRNRTAAS